MFEKINFNGILDIEDLKQARDDMTVEFINDLDASIGSEYLLINSSKGGFVLKDVKLKELEMEQDEIYYVFEKEGDDKPIFCLMEGYLKYFFKTLNQLKKLTDILCMEMTYKYKWVTDEIINLNMKENQEDISPKKDSDKSVGSSFYILSFKNDTILAGVNKIESKEIDANGDYIFRFPDLNEKIRESELFDNLYDIYVHHKNKISKCISDYELKEN